MEFIKTAEKTGYSRISVYKTEKHIVKEAEFDFNNIDFGRFQREIDSSRSDKERYWVIAKAFQGLADKGFFSPETRFKVEGIMRPRLIVKMPFLKMDDRELKIPSRMMALVERYVGLPKLFWDVYHPHNYGIAKDGNVYFGDLELFPKKT
ncbi:hypothetical protein GOV11_00995 [Candidatus Woesearchaeota archaeon]|nr:hypothetical protein [Candidatus Woesearchaeota archaeon]